MENKSRTLDIGDKMKAGDLHFGWTPIPAEMVGKRVDGSKRGFVIRPIKTNKKQP